MHIMQIRKILYTQGAEDLKFKLETCETIDAIFLYNMKVGSIGKISVECKKYS